MNHSRRHPELVEGSSCSGFTLIEILVVITIIAILAGLIIGASKYAMRRSATSTAKALIGGMEAALENYKADNGIYPQSAGGANSSTNVFGGLTGASGGKKYFSFRPEQVSGTKIMDPFGHEYEYKCPGTRNTATFDLWSDGYDGQSGTPATEVDDITNWQQ